ncbi:hypothetical protein Cni_G22291 [Canna indica]|uniref:Histone-lysine N-methyltransferase ATX4 n=1 Tax=Canna indica TaxID=4628 RepID=A0AAQ3QI43_9LILI|nr:hypothetical protein Cni_G22291 [Canna indica]
MDDSWLAKCVPTPSQLPPLPGLGPAPAPSATPQAVPLQLPPQVPAPVSAGQLCMNLRQHFHSFVAQEAFAKDQARVQETATISTFNLGSYRLGKKELGNSFLALLSSEFSQFPNSRTDIAKLHVGNDDKVPTSSGCVVPSINIPPLPENHGHAALGNRSELSSFVASRSSINSACVKVPFLHNNVRVAGNSYHDMGYVEQSPQQFSQCNNTGFEVNSTRNGWLNSSRSHNANQHPIMDVQASRIISFEGKPPISHNNTSFLRGRLVFCRNTVGELFMGDTGLFGVICFCHSSHMSVAKFCEHSGSTSMNPGEAVYLENGMSISHWCKQCLGLMAPEDAVGWEWSGSSTTKGVLVGPKASSPPTFLSTLGTTYNNKSFGGSWRSAEPLNNFGPSHPYMKTERTAREKSLNKQQGNGYQRYNFDGHDHFQENFPSSVQVSMPAPTKNQSLQTVMQSPIFVCSEKSHSTLNKGKEIVDQHLESYGVNHAGKCADHSVPLTCLGSNKTARNDCGISTSNFSAEAPLADRDGASSIELRLGQPSQKCHTFAASFPISVVEFESNCEPAKPQLHQQLKEQIDNAWDAKKARQIIHCTPSEASLSNKTLVQQTAKTVNAVNHSEPEHLPHDANKNPLISLFLSHLEGNSTSLSLDNLFNTNDHFSSRVPSSDSPSIKANVSNSVGDFNDDIQRKFDASKLDFSNKLDERKNLSDVDNSVVKSDCMVQNIQAADTREPTTQFSRKYCPSIIFGDGGGQSSFYLDQSIGSLHTSGVKNAKQHDKASFLLKKDCHDHATKGPFNPVPYGLVGPDSLNSDIPMSLSSTTVCSLEPNRKVFGTTQHLRDSNLKNIPLRHMVELSTQENSSSSLRTSLQHHKLCCLSSFHRDGCQDDLPIQKDSREGSYCGTHHDGSGIAVRSLYLCNSCQSGCGMDIFSGHPCHACSIRSCSCFGSTKRVPLNSEKYCTRFSTCCTRDIDEQACLRLGRLANNCFPGGVKHEICNPKEHSSCLSGHCCSSVSPYCVPGFCNSGVNNATNTLSERGTCPQVKIDHDKDHLPSDCKRIRLAHCDCSKNNIILSNDPQTTFWRDVPKKVFAHAGASSTGKFTPALETTKCIGDQLADCSADFNRTHQNSQSMRTQQMSNMSSGSSAPVVTEVSNEANNLSTCMANTRTTNVIQDYVVDEGSGNEKCGSSDEAVCDRECNEGLHLVGEVDAAKCRFHYLAGHSSVDLIDEMRLKNPFKTKRVKKVNEDSTAQEIINQKQNFERTPKAAKTNESMKHNRSDISVSLLDISVAPGAHNIETLEINVSQSQGNELFPEPGSAMQRKYVSSCGSSSVKRKRSTLSFNKSNFLERFGNKDMLPDNDDKLSLNDGCSLKIIETSRKKTKQDLTICSKHQNFTSIGKPPKFMSLNCIVNTSSNSKTILPNKNRPVVCGNSGIISTGGMVGDQKPAKIISLSLVLKRAKRCSPTEISNTDVNQEEEPMSWKLLQEKHASDLSENVKNPKMLHTSGESKECARKNSECSNALSTEKEADSENNMKVGLRLRPKQLIPQSRPKHQDVRTRSLRKLAPKHRHSTKTTCSSTSGTDECSSLFEQKNQINDSPSTTMGVDDQVKKLFPSNHSESTLKTIIGSFPCPRNEDHAGKLSQVSRRRYSRRYRCLSFRSNSDAFCCVCGSSNQEDGNQLLECNNCLIRVHQACYGVPKIPKGYWCCRPCKSNSQNIVCVLCGYGGGAMTRALKSQNIIKGLLKAWKVGKGSNSVKSVHSENTENEFSNLSSVDEPSKYSKSALVPPLGEILSHAIPQADSGLDLQKHTTVTQSKSDMPEKCQAPNSIIAGVLDPSVTQWVHMVCGLWTPGTRCPNVDTMSTFDVSGAFTSKKNIVCSICNRPGGSCIECRVPSCSIPFHPWCAHQKGLLQSEVEGDDNENVGFYGRCLHHATSSFHLDSHVMDPEESPRNKEWTCARTEGFRGRKRERGLQPNHQRPCKDGRSCIVSQEQIDAWLHINGQKSCTRGVLKPQCSDIECDFRKEYIRYKQSKGWKHLVVYKSGIHALGLYTSQFIARGAMVVEYVGEIVGLRVADNREAEYQSGRRIQYKSACYFFRIDKEHIIDATCKGGIARFVNHSCLPNCVAKVISVRNEKKVVFFAERDINPGEEITYDYHFNSEDEGKKIPCFCNSRNCRRYLN